MHSLNLADAPLARRLSARGWPTGRHSPVEIYLGGCRLSVDIFHVIVLSAPRALVDVTYNLKLRLPIFLVLVLLRIVRNEIS